MKRYFILFFIVLYSFGYSQNEKLFATKINQFGYNADLFLGFDQFRYYYFVKNNVFSITKNGTSLEYKNIALGEVTHIDRQNPLKIVLFYENFNTVILLDNQLNELQKINLTEITSPIIATAVGLASQNRLWIYNNLTQQIGFLDYLKNTFQTITPPFEGKIKYYESDFNSFQWIDEQLNWYSCDVFGKITTLGKIPDFDQVQIISNQSVLFTKGDLFYFYDVDKNKTSPIENVKKTFDNFYFKDQILSIFTNQEIHNYKITIP